MIFVFQAIPTGSILLKRVGRTSLHRLSSNILYLTHGPPAKVHLV